MTTQEQKHPQYNTDRKIVLSLLEQEATDYNLVELARLKIRYRGFPGAKDIQSDLERILQMWGYTDETLFEKTRPIHATGQIYRSKKTIKKIGFEGCILSSSRSRSDSPAKSRTKFSCATASFVAILCKYRNTV